MHVIIVLLPPVIYARRTDTSRNTKFGTCHDSEMAARAPGAVHVCHGVHDMLFVNFVLPPVIYVRRTFMQCNTNFGVYQASEMAASIP